MVSPFGMFKERGGSAQFMVASPDWGWPVERPNRINAAAADPPRHVIASAQWALAVIVCCCGVQLRATPDRRYSDPLQPLIEVWNAHRAVLPARPTVVRPRQRRQPALTANQRATLVAYVRYGGDRRAMRAELALGPEQLRCILRRLHHRQLIPREAFRETKSAQQKRSA